METDDEEYNKDEDGLGDYDDSGSGSGEGKNLPVFTQHSQHFFSLVPGML